MNAPSRIDELAERLARLTGEDVQTALQRALEERLARFAGSATIQREAALRRFFDRLSRLPVKDHRPIDELIGYGPDGLPK